MTGAEEIDNHNLLKYNIWHGSRRAKSKGDIRNVRRNTVDPRRVRQNSRRTRGTRFCEEKEVSERLKEAISLMETFRELRI